MVRGFLGGFVVGAALSVCAAAIISVLAGPPAPPQIAADAPSATDAPQDDAEASAPVPRRIEEGLRQPAASDLDAPDVVDRLAITDDTMRPAGRPETAEATPGVAEPAPTGQSGGVAVEGVAPIRPRTQAPAPGAPDTDSRAAITAEPPRPSGAGLSSPQPSPGGDAGLQGPAEVGADGPTAPGADTSVAGIASTPAPASPGQPDQPAVSAETAPRPETSPPRMAQAPTDPATPDSSVAGAGSARGDTARPGAGTNAPALTQPDDSAGAQVGNVAEDLADRGDDAQAGQTDDDTLPRTDTAPGAGTGTGGPAIGTPATSLLNRGTGATEAPDSPAEQTGAGNAEAGADAGLPALLRNAEPFENPDGQPLMSIILMDTGQNLEGGPIGLAALGSFPHPLSFAVDTRLPDAAERAARYRAEGLEVMALVDLPGNLTASDTEVALTTLLDRVPEAVGVLEGFETGLQGSAEMSAQVAAILQETGHGIVWQPNGLDTAQRLAARDGVASRTLYRDFDSEDQSAIVIRRFFDQAAFRAGQDGSVIMVGRVRPDTITALVIWGLQDRVRRVVVAPVSGVLTAGQEGG